MKLYIWEDVIHEYGAGIGFALASSEKEARELLKAQFPEDADDFNKKPDIVTDKAFASGLRGSA